jgi:phosphohistidine phosphatase SixA
MTRLFVLALLLFAASSSVRADEAAAWEALRQGGVALVRHAIAPGVGDPPGMRLDDCATQRNLDEAGRAQARRMGERFRANGVAPGAVLSSRWCRARETATLAFPGARSDAPAFDSFFGDRTDADRRTAEAIELIRGWKGPGPLVVVTHQVNVTALTGVFPASGEAVVVRVAEKGLAVLGRIRF